MFVIFSIHKLCCFNVSVNKTVPAEVKETKVILLSFLSFLFDINFLLNNELMRVVVEASVIPRCFAISCKELTDSLKGEIVADA